MSKPPPIELILRALTDPVTGKQVAAFVAASEADRSMLRERGFRLNTRVFAYLTRPRNPRFNRLVHGLGIILGRNLDRFTGKQSHAVIKELQFESGVCCDKTETPIPGVGVLISKKPQSLSFPNMGEDEFKAFWVGVCAYVIENDWPTLTEERLTEMAEIDAFKGAA
ncbi:hypothetical protein D3C84_716920 [compost metagenome]